jgi:uncharacterized membrane protein
LGFALTCSEECASEASEINTLNQRSKRLVGVGTKPSAVPSGVIVYGLFSAFFLGWFGLNYYRSGHVEYASLGLGLLFVFVAAFAYRKAKQLNLNC